MEVCVAGRRSKWRKCLGTKAFFVHQANERGVAGTVSCYLYGFCRAFKLRVGFDCRRTEGAGDLISRLLFLVFRSSSGCPSHWRWSNGFGFRYIGSAQKSE